MSLRKALGQSLKPCLHCTEGRVTEVKENLPRCGARSSGDVMAEESEPGTESNTSNSSTDSNNETGSPPQPSKCFFKNS